MSSFIAALPMYDWPETRAETDAQWAGLRDAFRAAGIEAPEGIVRCNADLPPVPGGIRDAAGAVVAPDPAALPPDELDFHALWLHPALLFAQTCWGPMEQGLAKHVQVVAQPSYEGMEGGQEELYSSAVVMRGPEQAVAAPSDGRAMLPMDLLQGRRFAFNSTDSMSGLIAVSRDLEAAGSGLDVFSRRIESGGHRASIVAIAEGRADVATIDCRSWALAQRFEPKAKEVVPVGWTALRKGLPYITARAMPAATVAAMRSALSKRA